MKYFEYVAKNHLTGKKNRGILTADNIDAAEDTLKRRGEDIVSITPLKDFLDIRKRIYDFSTSADKKTKCEFFTKIKNAIEKRELLW